MEKTTQLYSIEKASEGGFTRHDVRVYAKQAGVVLSRFGSSCYVGQFSVYATGTAEQHERFEALLWGDDEKRDWDYADYHGMEETPANGTDAYYQS